MPGDRADRERGAAARVAVDLGQDEAGHGDRVGEPLGDGHGLLAGHRVDDQQGLDRLDGRVDRADLVHERVVDREPARGVDDHDVATRALRGLDAAAGDVDRRRARPGRGGRRCRATCRASRAGPRRRAGTGRRPRAAAGGRAWRRASRASPPTSSCPSPGGRRARRRPGCPTGGTCGRRSRGAPSAPRGRSSRPAGRRSGSRGSRRRAARSRTRATNSLTTLKLTSASSSARRTSRIAASTSASDTRPRPVRPARVLRRRSLRLSNMRGRRPFAVGWRSGRPADAGRVVRGFWRHRGGGSVRHGPRRRPWPDGRGPRTRNARPASASRSRYPSRGDLGPPARPGAADPRHRAHAGAVAQRRVRPRCGRRRRSRCSAASSPGSRCRSWRS